MVPSLLRRPLLVLAGACAWAATVYAVVDPGLSQRDFLAWLALLGAAPAFHIVVWTVALWRRGRRERRR